MKSPLFPIGIVLLAGVITASNLPTQNILVTTFFIFAFMSLITLFLFRKKKMVSAILFYILVFLTGVVRFVDFNTLPENSIKFIAKEKPVTMVLQGTILTNPVFKRKYGHYPELEFILDLRAIKKSTWMGTSGKTLVKAYYSGDKTFQYGDEVVLSGELNLPRKTKEGDGFDYRAYLEAKKIYAVLKVGKTDIIKKISRKTGPFLALRTLLYSAKEKARDLMLINLTLPHSGILTAMLLGEKQFIDKSIEDIFVKTGTLHILAISGLHVGIIVSIFLGLFTLIGIPRKTACALAIVAIILYALMIGQRPSAWRAAIMASLFLVAFILNRQPNLVNVFSFALISLILINPNYIFDVGFILSFTCLVSIIWITPVMDKLLKVKNLLPLAGSRRVPKKGTSFGKHSKVFFYIFKSLSISLSVWIGILPIIAYYFNIVTPITIFANLVAVPFCFILVSLGISAIFINVLFPSFSVIFYEVIWLADKVMISILEFLSVIPCAFIQVKDFPIFLIFVYYTMLTVIFMLYRIKNNNVKNTIGR